MSPGGGDGRGLVPFCTSAAKAGRQPDHPIREKQLSTNRHLLEINQTIPKKGLMKKKR